MNRIDAAKEAVSRAGSSTKLARRLLPDTATDEQIQRMTWRIWKWMQAGVPPKYVLRVAEITGVASHRLHPEMYSRDAE